MIARHRRAEMNLECRFWQNGECAKAWLAAKRREERKPYLKRELLRPRAGDVCQPHEQCKPPTRADEPAFAAFSAWLIQPDDIVRATWNLMNEGDKEHWRAVARAVLRWTGLPEVEEFLDEPPAHDKA